MPHPRAAYMEALGGLAMDKSTEQSISIVGILFAVSVAFWANNLANYLGPVEITKTVLAGGTASIQQAKLHTAVITLVSGVLFLLDILCVLWWYAKYIYRIRPTSTLGTHFLDFGVVGMFVLASSKWTVPGIFLIATLIAVTLLALRFYLIYKGPDATDTDRQILIRALWGLGLAAVIVATLGLLTVVIVFALADGPEAIQKVRLNTLNSWILPAGPGALSAIGIALTLWLRDKIAIAVEIHDGTSRNFVPMPIHWPRELSSDGNAVGRIRNFTTEGLRNFDNSFTGQVGKLSHERVRSRVHAEGDLRVQSYVLSVPSYQEDLAQNEIAKKSFMVALSHWLDDLLDGRSEVITFRKLTELDEDYGFDLANSNLQNSESLFEYVYEQEIIRHTSKEFYTALLPKIRQCAVLPQNTKYLFWSLFRVAAGAVIFGPRVHKTDRKAILDKHNQKLLRLAEDSPATNEWKRDLRTILQDMQASEIGEILLGLTTKTVQDMAMASENRDVNFALVILYSLLYAPLLYFHDVTPEVETQEIVALDTFDVNYDVIIPWLSDIRGLCEDQGIEDDRRRYRLQQIEMAYLCFEKKLPAAVANGLRAVYLGPPPKEAIPFPRKKGG